MQPNFTLKKMKNSFQKMLLVFCLGISGMVNAQTLSTASGTNYQGNFSISNASPLSISFIIENTTASAVALTDLSCQIGPFSVTPAGTASVTKLFYSSTSLSGNYDLSAPGVWTQIGTGAVTVPAAVTVMPVITGINFIIPAGTQYRFIIEASRGLRFSFSPTPTPNTFSAGGLNLKVGNFQIAGQDIGYAGVSPVPNAGNHPAFFGGTATLISTVPCTGTPAPGNTLSTANPACPGINFTLSTQVTPAAGLSYQWQSGPSGTGPWSNVGTGSTYTTSQVAATFYRCNVTCAGNTATSTPLQVTMNNFNNCYCTPTYSNSCTFGDYIANVTLGTLNNTSVCTGQFTYYNAVAAPEIYPGYSRTLTVRVGPDTFGQWVGAWIDYNQDGIFSVSEFLGAPVNAGANGTVNINFTVPAGATLGTTRLRVRAGDDNAMTAAQSCGVSNSTFGEAEDYNVNITPCIQGVFTANPSNTSIQCSGNASFSVTTTGSALVYQWEQRINSGAPWTMVSNGGVFSGATTTTLSLSNVPGTMSGYQYRAVMQGPCTAVDFSGVGTLTVTPLIATVNPTSATICTGSIQQLTLTNASSPATVVFNASAGLPLNIPDNNPAGTSNSVAVSGIPGGAIVSNISVTFTMTHTWVGDVVMNLRSPNGQVLNLVGALNGGTGGNGTANFTNTTVSSTGVTAMSGAPAPRTGIFRADAFHPISFPSTAPTTTNTWAPLLGTLNGNWALAICDIGPADLGVLTSWSVTITYGAPAAGVWTSSPAAPNTMFTDAAATVPYVAGTPVNTIWVNPIVNTNYTVVYNTATPCTSTPTVIPVNVVNPVTAVVNPVNTAACIGNNASFSVSAGGGPLTYQWQVSTDGGLTWANVSGATSSTLNLTGVTTAMNNNRYRAVITASPCAGSTNSGSATLTVNSLPTVTISSPDLSLIPGQTTTITGTSAPAAASWSWTLDGSAISGTASSRTVGIDGQGTYRARVTDVNGCVNTSNNLTIGSEATDRLWIYPNPSEGAFQVRLYYSGTPTERRVVSIFKSNGQLVAEKEFTLVSVTNPYLRMDFDLGNLAAGTYVVKVNNVHTGKIVSGLVVIQ
jgi:subtilisin-like proprotein convertase family protein